jgi:hypothetical protein
VPSFNSPIDAPVTGDPKVLVVDVVKRVKCELYWAMIDHLPPILPPLNAKLSEKTGGDKSSLPKFDNKDQRFWLSQWDATVHLELVLNEQGGVAPGVTYSPSAFSHSFSLGIGGGITTQAVRTDDVQFSLSMAELIDEFDLKRAETEGYYNGCTHHGKELGDGAFLNGGLGLEEWTDSALGPTGCLSSDGETAPSQTCEEGHGFRYLRPGVHPSVSSAATAKPQSVSPVTIATPAAAGLGARCTDVDCIKKAVQRLQQQLDPKGKLTTDLDKLKSNLKTIIAPMYANAKSQPKLCPRLPAEAETDYSNATTLADEKLTEANGLVYSIGDAIKDVVPGDVCASYQDSYCNAVNSQIDTADAAIVTLSKEELIAAEAGKGIYKITRDCPDLLITSEKKPALDPPLDNISHTVQFVVASNVTATPSWTLARFKSSTSPSLASLSHNNTQTLSIVLGPASNAKVPVGNQSAIDAAGLNATLRELLSVP